MRKAKTSLDSELIEQIVVKLQMRVRGKTLSRIAKIRSRSLSNSALSQGERKFALFPLSGEGARRAGEGKKFAQQTVKNLFTYLPINLFTSNKLDCFARPADGGNGTRNDETTLVPSKCAAFTLAEVLITLGIIGVVAAMTMPTVINNTKKKELETAFKKSYSLLSQITLRVVNEDYGGLAPNLDNEFVNNFTKYLVNSPKCKADRTCIYSNIAKSSKNNFGDFIMSNYKTYNGKNPAIFCNDGLIELSDMLIFFDYQMPTEDMYGMRVMCVDTNGWNKKPNKFGHDFFMFYVNDSGQLLPMGAKNAFWGEERFCNSAGSDGANGYGCASKALSENDYFKNLP